MRDCIVDVRFQNLPFGIGVFGDGEERGVVHYGLDARDAEEGGGERGGDGIGGSEVLDGGSVGWEYWYVWKEFERVEVWGGFGFDE